MIRKTSQPPGGMKVGSGTDTSETESLVTFYDVCAEEAYGSKQNNFNTNPRFSAAKSARYNVPNESSESDERESSDDEVYIGKAAWRLHAREQRLTQAPGQNTQKAREDNASVSSVDCVVGAFGDQRRYHSNKQDDALLSSSSDSENETSKKSVAHKRPIKGETGTIRFRGRRYRPTATDKSGEASDGRVNGVIPNVCQSYKPRPPPLDKLTSQTGKYCPALPEIDIISPSPTLSSASTLKEGYFSQERQGKKFRVPLLKMVLGANRINSGLRPPVRHEGNLCRTSSSDTVSPSLSLSPCNSNRCHSTSSDGSNTSPLPPLKGTPVLRRRNLLPPINTGDRSPSSNSSRASSPASIDSLFFPVDLPHTTELRDMPRSPLESDITFSAFQPLAAPLPPPEGACNRKQGEGQSQLSPLRANDTFSPFPFHISPHIEQTESQNSRHMIGLIDTTNMEGKADPTYSNSHSPKYRSDGTINTFSDTCDKTGPIAEDSPLCNTWPADGSSPRYVNSGPVYSDSLQNKPEPIYSDSATYDTFGPRYGLKQEPQNMENRPEQFRLRPSQAKEPGYSEWLYGPQQATEPASAWLNRRQSEAKLPFSGITKQKSTEKYSKRMSWFPGHPVERSMEENFPGDSSMSFYNSQSSMDVQASLSPPPQINLPSDVRLPVLRPKLSVTDNYQSPTVRALAERQIKTSFSLQEETPPTLGIVGTRKKRYSREEKALMEYRIPNQMSAALEGGRAVFSQCGETLAGGMASGPKLEGDDRCSQMLFKRQAGSCEENDTTSKNFCKQLRSLSLGSRRVSQRSHKTAPSRQARHEPPPPPSHTGLT